jgi:LysM repeat protein
MFSLRVTAPDGTTRTHPFPGTQVTIGRDASNTIVLEGTGVSAFHCMIEVQAGGVCTLKERGSTNGTWLNGKRLEEPTRVGDDDQFYVGTFLVQVTRMAPVPEVRPGTGPLPELGMSGPILRGPAPHRAWRDMHAKLLRYAEQWDIAERPARLLLASDEIPRAKRWLATPPPSVADNVDAIIRDFVAQSVVAGQRRMVFAILGGVVGVLALGGLTALLVVFWPAPVDRKEDTAAATEAAPEDGGREAEGAAEDEDEGEEEEEDDDDGGKAPTEQTDDTEGKIVHTIIPTETLDDIAKRYGVEVQDLVEWNLVNPDAKLEPGKTLTIERPKNRPLPQVEVKVQIEAGATWSKLATRFGIDVTRLRAFNPGVEALEPGKTLIVWVDPKPYKPREPRQAIPKFDFDDSAVSIGNPNSGSLENGIKMQESDAYTFVSGFIYGSAYAMENLQTALANFRQDVDFDGQIVISDLSKKGGGQLDPHKSHQAGRDVDIWLPNVKGVYRKKERSVGMKSIHRAVGDEIDWYATWGLVRALIQTGSVHSIFLDYDRQKYVYDAARNMGATKEQLDAWIQYPRGKTSSKGIFRHSAEHFTHIHVRFRCAKYEDRCKDTTAHPGD